MKRTQKKKIGTIINKRKTFYLSLYLTLILFIVMVAPSLYRVLTDGEHQNFEIVKNFLTSVPILLILMYLVSGIQVLIFGFLFRFKKWATFLLILLWFMFNIMFWNYLNHLKLVDSHS